VFEHGFFGLKYKIENIVIKIVASMGPHPNGCGRGNEASFPTRQLGYFNFRANTPPSGVETDWFPEKFSPNLSLKFVSVLHTNLKERLWNLIFPKAGVMRPRNQRQAARAWNPVMPIGVEEDAV
jgi:hypothetical protein